MRCLNAPTMVAVALMMLGIGAGSASAAAPVITKANASEVTITSATLEADINLGGQTILYYFEYGAADCSANPCAKVPGGEGEVKPGDLPPGIESAQVKAPLDGLAARTTYHFRVVATNGPQTTEGPDRTFTTYLEPQVFQPCANDQFRTANPAATRIEHSSANLADCRAYERASPLDKNAGDVTGTVPLARAALSGGKITFVSTTGVPGAKGSQEFPPYLASRGTGAWSTEGMLPPGNTGQLALVLGWTPDFSAVFSKATLLGEPSSTTFLMTPAGSAPIKIVDYTPELLPRFAGITAGAAHVLFESKVALPGVAGALEGKSNLYLWDKASGKLILAGIENDGQAPPSGAFAGSYDWVQGTNPATLAVGGADREYYTQEQHVISVDGEATYFTAAGTGQLYVRKNPTVKQSPVDLNGKCIEPSLACTIRVSASQKTNGIIPGGADPAGSRPAAFMGASTDGSFSFLTSSEKLTNDANTGPEQEPAAIERADIDGTDILPAFVLTHASDVEVSTTHVYWINSESGVIQRAELTGSNVEEVIGAEDTDNPRGIELDGEYIYWANAAGEEGEGTIGRAKLGATEVEEVEEDFVETPGNPHDVAVEGEYIYWTNSAGPISNISYIGRAKLADGGEANAEFVEDFAGEMNTIWGLAADSEHIYWMVRHRQGANRIRRIDIDGDPTTARNNFIDLGAGMEGKDIGLDASYVYWSTQTNGLIGRAELNGDEAEASEVEPEWIKDADHPQGIAVNATHIYWGANGEAVPNPGNDLYRYEVDSGKLSDLSVDSDATAGADVQGVLGASEDGEYVYYAANGVPDNVSNSPNAQGESAVAGNCNGKVGPGASGACNLYLWHEGANSFIARLDIGGFETQTDVTNWMATTENIYPTSNFEKTARISPDGRTLLFRSQRQLTDYDNEGIAQLYRYRAGDPGPACVSCNPTGIPPTSPGPGFGDVFTTVVVPTNPASVVGHNLSSDGNRIFFETTDALVAADTNGATKCPFVGSSLQSYPSCLDVYEWEAQGTGTCDAEHAVAEGGCLYLISTGKGKYPALIADASGDGNDIFFYSRSRLVGEDEDQLMDVYDARVDGGLASQNEPPPTFCRSVDSCHGAPLPSAEIESPPKSPHAGNPKAKRPPCKKGKHRVKGRCVKKRGKAKKHHKKGGRRANANRRAGR